MGPRNGITTKEELHRLIGMLAMSEWREAVAKASRQLQHEYPQDVKKAMEVLAEVVGTQRPLKSKKVAKHLATQSSLYGVSEELVKKLLGANPKAYKRPLAGALSSVIRGELDLAIQAVTASKPKHAKLVERLGDPDANQWAAWLQKVIFWKPTRQEAMAGQVATLSGQFLERVRKSTEAFRDARKEAFRTVEAYNQSLHPATDAAGKSLKFGRPRFFEDMVDGDGKLLSDGMDLAFDSQDQVLVSVIEEVKLKSVGADAFPQFDQDLVRIRQRGIRLADGRYFAPDKIVLPVSPAAAEGATRMGAYIEGTVPRQAITPRGYRVTVNGVDASGVREFAQDLLLEWRRRLAASKVLPE